MEGINNLFLTGKRLNLKNQVISSAAIYYHKFFKKINHSNLDESQLVQQSNQKLDLKLDLKLNQQPSHQANLQSSSQLIDENLIACTCLYLASKVEECPIKCKNLLCAFNDCINKTDELSFNKFTELNSSIVFCEVLICQVINFELNNKLPHKYLLHYIRSLNEWLFNDQDESVQFSNLCWSLLIDFYRSPDCIQSFQPQEISVSIIQIAVRVFKDKLEQENNLNLEQILDHTTKFYDQLDKDNLWKINLIIMKTFQFH